jgi:hypothetical protein
MDIEYLIIGAIFLLTGIAIIIYEFKYHTIKEDEATSFQYYSVKGSIILILLALYLLWEEIKKVI